MTQIKHILSKISQFVDESPDEYALQAVIDRAKNDDRIPLRYVSLVIKEGAE